MHLTQQSIALICGYFVTSLVLAGFWAWQYPFPLGQCGTCVFGQLQLPTLFR